MSSNNPDITASDIITDVENRLGSPNITSTAYLPWISYAYTKVYRALIGTNQMVKESLFGEVATLTLTNGTAEYSLEENIPQFGSFIKVEVKYGATGDDWVTATKLPSLANWEIQNNVSTSYRAKTNPLYYKIGDKLGFIPTPPAADTGTPQAKVWYIKRPYQITLVTDVIDLPYRFTYPIANYVQARAIEMLNEDYSQSMMIENKFERELQMLAEFADSENNENDGTESVQVASGSSLFVDPFR